MNDEGNQAKRDPGTGAQGAGATAVAKNSIRTALGDLTDAVNATLKNAADERVVERIWNRDASLWKDDPAHQKIINNSLGWLNVAGEMLGVAGELTKFASEIAESNEFRHVMVCGMGGSSLCPEVLRQTFGKQQNFPELLVLDSTDPDVINLFRKQIDVEKCLFIIASKSGTTTEPIAFHRYWYDEVAQRSQAPGSSFITITDPGSLMADTAAAEGFRCIFLNQSNIGGRYSALSYFGMVPAALMGLDPAQLLEPADALSDSCGAGVAIEQNPAAVLGAVMAEGALAGRDKLTIVTDESLSAVGLWIEQLIAESTGKEGKGIVPVVGEALLDAGEYGNDRIFVSISDGLPNEQTRVKLDALVNAGHPVVYRSLSGVYDLGAEFFLWEMATAFAGWRLKINPFDQPNVQESKDATRTLLQEYERSGELQKQAPVASDDTIAVYTGKDGPTTNSVADALREHCSRIKTGDYVAILAYVEETPEIEARLQSIRNEITQETGCAATTGYGPRFLHSTGQLHKGGPDSGVFFQITSPDRIDFPVPHDKYTFSVLKDAQALGDFQSLLAHGRRAIRVDVGTDVAAGLQRLHDLLKHVLPTSDQ